MEHTMDADPQLNWTKPIDRNSISTPKWETDQPILLKKYMFFIIHSLAIMQPNKMADMLEHVISAQNCGWDLDLQPTLQIAPGLLLYFPIPQHPPLRRYGDKWYSFLWARFGCGFISASTELEIDVDNMSQTDNVDMAQRFANRLI